MKQKELSRFAPVKCEIPTLVNYFEQRSFRKYVVVYFETPTYNWLHFVKTLSN